MTAVLHQTNMEPTTDPKKTTVFSKVHWGSKLVWGKSRFTLNRMRCWKASPVPAPQSESEHRGKGLGSELKQFGLGIEHAGFTSSGLGVAALGFMTLMFGLRICASLV